MQLRFPNSILITMVLSAVTVSKTASAAFLSPSAKRHVFRSSISAATTRTHFGENYMYNKNKQSSSAIISSPTFAALPKYNQKFMLSSTTKCQMVPPTTAMDADTDTETITNNSVTELKGMNWVREQIVTVLNDEFDSKEVARSIALSKLEPKKKKNKKKKKKKNNDETGTTAQTEAPKEEGPPPLTQEEKDAIGNKAAEEALPFGISDTMVTPATKLEFGDYQCNAAMSLAKNVGMSPR